MSHSMTLNVRVNGPLGEFVAANVGGSGTYENVSEYVRDLIRKDKERAELGAAFAEPDDAFDALTADELIARNRARQS
jgi:antitoxin ParD1/3/4